MDPNRTDYTAIKLYSTENNFLDRKRPKNIRRVCTLSFIVK